MPEPDNAELVEQVRPWVARGAKVTLDFANSQTVTQEQALAALDRLRSHVRALEDVMEAARDFAVHVPNGRASDPYKHALYVALARLDKEVPDA